MNNTITAEELIAIINKSELDPTIKDILIRDIKKEGANQFYVEQVLAYCDNAIEILQNKMKDQQQNSAS